MYDLLDEQWYKWHSYLGNRYFLKYWKRKVSHQSKPPAGIESRVVPVEKKKGWKIQSIGKTCNKPSTQKKSGEIAKQNTDEPEWRFYGRVGRTGLLFVLLKGTCSGALHWALPVVSSQRFGNPFPPEHLLPHPARCHSRFSSCLLRLYSDTTILMKHRFTCANVTEKLRRC